MSNEISPLAVKLLDAQIEVDRLTVEVSVQLIRHMQQLDNLRTAIVERDAAELVLSNLVAKARRRLIA